MVRRGALIRVRRGWVAAPGASSDLVEAVRRGGVLSCVSALRRHGVWTGGFGVHTRVPAYWKGREDAGTHRSLRRTRYPEPASALDCLERALQHATLCQPRSLAIASLDSALNQRLLDRAGLRTILSELPGRYAAYEPLVDAGAQSGLETIARLKLRSHRIRYASQVWIADVGRVDLLVGDRLVIELDGRTWHSSREAFHEDRRRDLALVHQGYSVVRLAADHVEDPAVWERIYNLAARRAHRGSRSTRKRSVPISPTGRRQPAAPSGWDG